MRTRLLCISPYFPPLVNAEAICSGKIINELLRIGIEVTVLSVAYGEANVGAVYDNSSLWRRLSAVDVSIPPHGHLTKFASGPLAVKYHVSSWPRWMHRALRVAVDIHQSNPFQVIYSRSYPMIAHVAA